MSMCFMWCADSDKKYNIKYYFPRNTFGKYALRKYFEVELKVEFL